MEKEILADITAPAHKKRSIRDIPIPPTRRNNSDSKNSFENDSFEINLKKDREEYEVKDLKEKIPPRKITPDDFEDDYEEEPYKIKGRGKKKKIIFGSIFILVLVFVLMSFFEKATVIIYPKSASAEINENLEIFEIDSLNSEFELGYRELNFSKEDEVVISATGEEKISEKASGEITIFNEFTTKEQGLLKNTRFESSDGKIYTVADSISVPGYTEKDGKIIPGKLDVVVHAKEVGENYNIDGEMDFTIPGFKGQEQFDHFYAKNKTGITGGFNGIKKVVSETDLENAKIRLTASLKQKILNEIQEQLPQNLVPIYSEDKFVFSEVIQENYEDDKVKVKMTGNLSVMVVDKSQLAKKIAEKKLSDYRKNEEISIVNLNELTIKFIEENNDSELDTQKTFVNLAGQAKFEWQNDENLLRDELVGINRSKIKDVFSGFTGITKGEVTIIPFWKTSFPDKKDNITINVEHPY